MNKLRWGKFFWSDWSDDPALALCSLAAQGLWMRLMCIAAQGTPYGYVTINGKPPSLDDLARLIRPRVTVVRIERLIGELERRGVASRNAKGILFSRRMESDWTLFGIRSKAAKSRWNKETGSDLHMQNSDFAYLESHTLNKQTESPRSPPTADAAGGGADDGSNDGGKRKRFRANGTNPRALGTNPRATRSNPRASKNAMCDIVWEELGDAEADEPRPDRARVVSIARHLNRRDDDA